MLFDDREITSTASLLEALDATTGPGTIRWYRGHGDGAWPLVPSIGRAPNRPETERALITRFKQDALSFLDRPPASEWEWLLLMRHHTLPTRLLDWSENPIVGLFFVVSEYADRNGCLWSLDPVGLNSASYPTPDIPCFGINEELENFSTTSVHTLPSRLTPVAALAMRSFPRLTAQSGVFTMTHKDQTPLEALEDGRYVGRLIVPSTAKPRLAKELALLGVTRLSLFPELDNVAKRAQEVVG